MVMSDLFGKCWKLQHLLISNKVCLGLNKVHKVNVVTTQMVLVTVMLVLPTIKSWKLVSADKLHRLNIELQDQ